MSRQKQQNVKPIFKVSYLASGGTRVPELVSEVHTGGLVEPEGVALAVFGEFSGSKCVVWSPS